ncbi:hypothetical protein WAI453_001195 [Rhynchosporium graminicola]
MFRQAKNVRKATDGYECPSCDWLSNVCLDISEIALTQQERPIAALRGLGFRTKQRETAKIEHSHQIVIKMQDRFHDGLYDIAGES